jgi:predicted nucleic acid-binding protein
MVEEEEHHGAALRALASSADGFTSTHAVAETFATLTSGRLEVQPTPAEATQVIDANVIRRLQVVDLGLSDYQQAMRNSQMVGARGGAIFDMLHLQAARRGAAKRILTLNVVVGLQDAAVKELRDRLLNPSPLRRFG